MSQHFQSDNFRVPRRVSIGSTRATCKTAVAALASGAFSFVPLAPLVTLLLAALGLRTTGRDATLRGRAFAKVAVAVGVVALTAQAAVATVGWSRHSLITRGIGDVTARAADGNVSGFAEAFAAADPLATAETRERMLSSFFRLLELRYGEFQGVTPLAGPGAALNPPGTGVAYRMAFARQTVEARVDFDNDLSLVPHFLRPVRFEVVDEADTRIVYPPPARVAAFD